MQDMSFNALIRFPSNFYFDFNKAMQGIATVDSIAREGDGYNANIEFPLTEMKDCIDAITSIAGNIIQIAPEKISAVVQKSSKGNGKSRRAKRGTRLDELKGHLKSWKTAKQLMDLTDSKNSSIYARFTKLKENDLLESKNGPDGRMMYRLAAAAA